MYRQIYIKLYVEIEKYGELCVLLFKYSCC